MSEKFQQKEALRSTSSITRPSLIQIKVNQAQQRPQVVNISRSITTPVNKSDKSIRSAGLVVDALQKRRLNTPFVSNYASKNVNGRSPKRTPHEIVLDKLEVNWSVPHIRSVFQQNKDVKPPNIDTLYARVA